MSAQAPVVQEPDRQYLVVYEDVYGDEEVTFMVTSLPPELAFKLLGIDKVKVCEEVEE